MLFRSDYSQERWKLARKSLSPHSRCFLAGLDSLHLLLSSEEEAHINFTDRFLFVCLFQTRRIKIDITGSRLQHCQFVLRPAGS